jgi:hypothetical protein
MLKEAAASYRPVFKRQTPAWVRWLGGRENHGEYRARWGSMATDRCQFALQLCLFEDGYSLNLAFLWLAVYINLPFLRRWVRDPEEIMESWGASYSMEYGIHMRWARRYKFIVMPWRNWEQISHDVLRPDGRWVPFVGSWEESQDHRLGGKEPDGRHVETHPYKYMLSSGEVQERTATVHAERRIRRLKWLWWTSLFQRVTHAIDVSFSDEVGDRSGSWKGGCIGCGWELKPDETIECCLKRMERERKF